MKHLVVYYSRTGTTKKVAQALCNFLGSDIEEIAPMRKYSGLFGFFRAGYEATRKKLPNIHEVKNNPSQYDVVILGTPVWGSTLASPLRTYVSKYAEDFKKVSFFLTKGGEGQTRTFAELEGLCGKEPAAILELRKQDVMNKEKFETESIQKIENFLKRSFNR